MHYRLILFQLIFSWYRPCISNCLQWLHFSETEFVGGYEDGSDTSEGSTSAGIGTLNALPATRVSFKPSDIYLKIKKVLT